PHAVYDGRLYRLGRYTTPVVLMQCTTDVSTDLGDIQCGISVAPWRDNSNTSNSVPEQATMARLGSPMSKPRGPAAWSTSTAAPWLPPATEWVAIGISSRMIRIGFRV